MSGRRGPHPGGSLRLGVRQLRRGGLTDTIKPALVANGVGAEWEGTLNAGQVDHIALSWRAAPSPLPSPPPPSPPPEDGGTPPPPAPEEEQKLPPPEPGETLNALRKCCTVKIKLPGSNRFVELGEGEQIPVGTAVDTRKGRITLVAASNAYGGKATADVYAGLFRIGQTGGKSRSRR